MNILLPNLLFNGDRECTKVMLRTVSGIALSINKQSHRKVEHYLHSTVYNSLEIKFTDDGYINDIGTIFFNGLDLQIPTNQAIRTYKVLKQLE